MYVRTIHRIRTSSTEIYHLIIAWVAISYAFAIMLLWGGSQPTIEAILGPTIYEPLTISLITVGFAFLLHEMAHKVVAQRFGYWAEFRASPLMLLIAVALAYDIGLIFAAPGAVHIFGPNISRRENGIISIAGPLSNMIVAFAFAPLWLFGEGIVGDIGFYGTLINAALAIFNLLPVGILDGRKVWRWNKLIYLSAALASAALMFLVAGLYGL